VLQFIVRQLMVTCHRAQNPFYEVDMPIRCELFTYHVDRLIERNTRELKKSRSTIGDA
jgi:hypothetical protein